jgi:hypothetical protein
MVNRTQKKSSKRMTLNFLLCAQDLMDHAVHAARTKQGGVNMANVLRRVRNSNAVFVLSCSPP